MTGLEPLILTIASVSSMLMSTAAVGIPLKSMAPTTFSVGWKLVRFFKKAYAITKLSKCLFFSVYVRIPRKSDKELVEFKELISYIFKRYDAKEVYRFYKFAKELSPLAVSCNLYADPIFMKHKHEILINADRYKSYIAKALYCNVLASIIEVQLWAAKPSAKDVKKLKYSLTFNIAKNEDVSIEQCQLLCEEFEKNINQYQMSQYQKYETEFNHEKKVICDILTKLSNDDNHFDEGAMGSIHMINKAVARQKNAIGYDNISGTTTALQQANARVEASLNVKTGSIEERERERALMRRETNGTFTSSIISETSSTTNGTATPTELNSMF